MYSNQLRNEIERKWLVSRLPSIRTPKGEAIEQGYIVVGKDGSEVRIRRRGRKCYLTLKSRGKMVRRELEIEISPRQFKALWGATKGRQLRKTRYVIPYSYWRIELDVFKGKLAGLVLAEVEFKSVSGSKRFFPPTWFGREVTTSDQFKNKCLAAKGRPKRWGSRHHST